jgi:hypothetical protein
MPNQFSRYGNTFSLDIISERTLRSEDLIEAFSEELHRLAPFNYKAIRSDGAAWIMNERLGIDTDEHHEDGSYIVNELIDALNDIASKHNAWFGTIEGDGACFAFQSYDDDNETFDNGEYDDDQHMVA